MTVTQLVVNFRAGLLGLLPAFERAGIPWKRPEAYDEWDEMASAAYRALVVEPLRASLAGTERERFILPDYDMLLPTYVGASVIEMLPPSADGSIRVFHALGTAAKPLDSVESRAIAPTGMPRSDALESSPLESARLVLRLWADGLPVRRIEEIELPPPPTPTASHWGGEV